MLVLRWLRKFFLLGYFVRATYLFVRNVFWMGTVGTMVRRCAAGLVEFQLILVTVVVQRSMVGLRRAEVRVASMVVVLY